MSEVNLDLDAIVACHSLQGRIDVLGESVFQDFVVLRDFVVRLLHDLVASLLEEADIWRGGRGACERETTVN